MKKTHTNNYMLDRLSGFFFDLMIVAGMAASDWQSLGGNLIPLLLICTAGGFGTFFYIRWVCFKTFPEYKYEAFFSMFGMLTGTASTGMILLREVDNEFKTPAAQNLVLQQLPAIAFGFPIMLLLPRAAIGDTVQQKVANTAIVLGIIAILFVIYNIWLFRKSIFKKAYSKNTENKKGE